MVRTANEQRPLAHGISRQPMGRLFSKDQATTHGLQQQQPAHDSGYSPAHASANSLPRASVDQ